MRIDGELVGIQKYDALEKVSSMSVDVDVCFGKELELFTNKLDSLAMSTIDIHDIFLDGLFVLVQLLDEPIHECFFSRSTDSIKQKMRDLAVGYEVGEFVLQGSVEGWVGVGGCCSGVGREGSLSGDRFLGQHPLSGVLQYGARVFFKFKKRKSI